MRYIIAAAILMLGMLVSLVAKIPVYAGISLISVLLLAFLAEKVLGYSLYFTVLIRKNIITLKDIEDLDIKEHFNG